MPPLLRSLRPQQWPKNSFVVLPLVFAGLLGDPSALSLSMLAFAAFCAASSAVYLLNDIRDCEQDLLHPLKKLRPIASGELSLGKAKVTAVLLAAAALSAGLLLGSDFSILVSAYLGLNLAYSFGLKHVVILDVMSIAIGFVLRVLAGGAAIDVPVSSWLLLCTIFLALFLAFSKRRHELGLLEESASAQRQVLDHYSPVFLDQMINVVTSSTVLAYALYVISPETVERFGSRDLIFTMPMVLFGVFRYLYLIYQRPGERNPTEAFVSDGPFLINLFVWGLAVTWIIYAR